jgi:DNA-binding response OmpR family regulator
MKILIVDDDRVLADILAYTFRRDDFQVVLAYDGLSALSMFAQEQPELVILDVNLPGMDGFTVCHQIRQESDTPIIMLTVRGEDDDIVHGLELGADDYVPKPFSPRQLVARAHAVLRRFKQTSAIQRGEEESVEQGPQPAMRPAARAVTSRPLQVGNLTLEANGREVRVGDGNPIQLSDQESRLLKLLMLNGGQIVPIETLYERVWGSKSGGTDDLRQLVRRLRNKIETNASYPVHIKNIPGLGYGLIPVDEEGA